VFCLSNAREVTLLSSICQWCGLIGVGVGDAAAGAIGSTYGRRRWWMSRKTVLGTFSGALAMLLVAAAVAIVSPASIGCSSRGGLSASATANVLSCAFSRAFLTRHNVAMLFAMLAAAGIETSTDSLDNLVCYASHLSHLTPHTSHLTSHTSHLTPHTSHLTPHTSHLTPHTSHLTPHTSHFANDQCAADFAAVDDCSGSCGVRLTHQHTMRTQLRCK
jgi:hypothetical protein